MQFVGAMGGGKVELSGCTVSSQPTFTTITVAGPFAGDMTIIGGTNAIVVIGNGDEIAERKRFPVTNADETLALVRGQLDQWNAQAPFEALGIACFGPLGISAGRIDYGRMLLTPKAGWTGADVLGALSGAIAGPAKIDLDVNAAALAEGMFGAAAACKDFAYITVGTGVGIGFISDSRPIVGRMHPEAGHMRLRRFKDDVFPGACEFHGDCLAGLVAGPALAARTGMNGQDIADDHPLWPTVIDALSEACANLFTTLSLERIVIGGGVVVSRPHIVGAIAAATTGKLCDFPPDLQQPAPISVASLGADAGPRGALLLASQCLSDRTCKPIR